jgi:hypothetical protein
VLHLSFIAPADKIADKKMCAPTCVMQYADEVLVPAHAYKKKNAPAAVAPNFLHPTFAQKEIFAASPACNFLPSAGTFESSKKWKR